VRSAGFFEKYVLSLLFLKTAFDAAIALRDFVGRSQAGIVDLVSSAQSAYVLQYALVVVYSLFFGLTLLVNKPPVHNARRWREIVIPLLATLLPYGFAGLASAAPESATRSLLPADLQRAAIAAAAVVSVAGYVLALWSLAYLGRSLSVLVSMRTIVLSGPYRYVRHPMYSAYMFLVAGLALASASLFSIGLLVVYVCLSIWRARLEEEMLGSLSEEYRRYAEQTGFLFPAIGRATRR